MGRKLTTNAAAEEANVAIAARNGDFVKQVTDEIVASGCTSIGVVTDVPDGAACAALVEGTLERYGGPNASRSAVSFCSTAGHPASRTRHPPDNLHPTTHTITRISARCAAR
jgi:NAD(P)-dependent dehydrogenase (short-subunit alcohol dehydrogenase family)